MIEIKKVRAGICDGCKKPADYVINADADEWGGAKRMCQVCMLGYAKNNELIRAVLLLQSGTE